MNRIANTSLMAGVLFAGLSLLSSCSNETPMPEITGGARLTIDINYPDQSQVSRTLLSETDGDLACVWKAGDRIVVTNENGGVVGILSLLDQYDGKDKGRFDGMLTGLADGDHNLKFHYLGSGNDTSVTGGCRLDLSSQSGSITGLSDNDLLLSTATVTIDGNSAFAENMNLSRAFAFGRFHLVFPDGVAAEGETVTVSGENLRNMANLDFSGSLTYEQGNISATVQSRNEVYLTIIPADGITPTFEVTVDGTTYQGSLATRDWKAGEYVRQENTDGSFSGIDVVMTGTGSDDEGDDVDTAGPVFEIDGKKYKFTTGNLWYNTRSGEWGIFESPAYYYNACGSDVASATTLTSPEYIDHFSWGANGLEDAQLPTTVKELAWQTAYNGAYFPTTGGSSSNYGIKSLWDNLYIYDWGTAYMRNGAPAGDSRKYITPSSSIFAELFSNAYVQGATIKGAGLNGEDVHGLIVIPGITNKTEARELITNVEGATCLSTMTDVIHNNSGNTLLYKYITLDNVEVLRKLNDALFFVAAGRHNFTSGTIYNTKDVGWYWTSYGGQGTNAMNMDFDGTKGGFFYKVINSTNNSSAGRDQKFSVRLLVEVD